MGSIIPSKNFFVADNNVPALCTTKQVDSYTWIFYYGPTPGGREIRYSRWTPDPVSNSVDDTEIKVDNGPVIDGDFSDIACTTWNNQVQVYYISKSDRLIKGVYYDESGTVGSKWKQSSIDSAGFFASILSPLSAIGNAGFTTDNGTISVMFLDKNNQDILTEAYYKDGSWGKKPIDYKDSQN